MLKLRRLVPRAAKAALADAVRAHTFRRAARAIAALPLGKVPTYEILGQLILGWGNEGMTADIDYIGEVARHAVTSPGPVLECGSGLTTVLLGMLAGRRGVHVWSLEHLPEWQRRVEGALRNHRVPNTEVRLSPLRSFGEFSWYDVPLATMPHGFQLVVCDGPPGDTPGGRYGLLPVMQEHLAPGAVILLDDADRPGEAEALNRWTAEAPMEVSLRPTSHGVFASVTLRRER